jgi:putative ATP-dependent endonuclease of OLD family
MARLEQPVQAGMQGRNVRLTGIKILNHSRLRDVEIDVRQHLVLVGANDVGKSSLLRCLDLVLGATTAQLYSRIGVEDFRDAGSDLVVEVTLAGMTGHEKAAFPDEIRVESDGAEPRLAIQLQASLDGGETLQLRRTAPFGATGRQITREQMAMIGWKSIGAAQGASRDFRDERNSVLDEILAAIELGKETERFDAIAEQFQNQLSESAVLLDLRKRLATQLSKAVPSRISTGDLSFVTSAKATDDVLADVRLRVQRDGKERSLAEQSDGARALFAIALYDLVSASANIVSIDEPEIHLHPTSQRSLAKLLKAGGNQKIIATHSPDMVGAFSPDDIVVVRQGGELIQPKKGFLSAEAKLVVHWWVKDKLEPLTSSTVVLVEGASDRVVVARIAELLGKDLDRLGVTLMEMDGSGDAVHIRTLFGPSGFGISTRVLIDEDAVAKTAPEFGVEAEELSDDVALEAQGVFVSHADLEDEYTAAMGPDRLWKAIEASKLFSNNERATCAANGEGGTRTVADVAAFCRYKKRKVRAALLVVDQINREEAAKVASVVKLLDSVEDDD